MLELDIQIDTELRARAVSAAETFIRASGTPVSRAQIAGLVQIAANEPGLLSRFAGSQRDRAEKRAAGMREGDRKAELQNEVAFWELVRMLCEGQGKNCSWSLLQVREAVLDAPRVEKLAPGTALSKEDRARRDEKKKAAEDWERAWARDHYTGFFRHFCAHYVYRLPTDKR